MSAANSAELRRHAEALWSQGETARAADQAFAALAAAPGDQAAKALAARLLRAAPAAVRPDHEAALMALLCDPDVDPDELSGAGWPLALPRLPAVSSPEAIAQAAEADPLALRLLEEAPVAAPEAERRLTAVRRWMLQSRAWDRFAKLARALVAQAALNGGAWFVEPDEAAALGQEERHVFGAAYPPIAPAPAAATHQGPAVVRDQYERWPYPRWRRITRRPPDERSTAGRGADILIAGCGTGREAAAAAIRRPAARVLAIDVSQASLDYAADRCAALGVGAVEFVRADLRDCADLGRAFDSIYCSGVLHHLADPEAGWRALASVLKPQGRMRLGLYSRIARLPVAAARRLFVDLAAQPASDDRTRAVRRRLLAEPPQSPARWVIGSRDFATLEGAADLLLHPHEDLFDIPRIERCIRALGLRFERFLLPTPADLTCYRAQFPDDPDCRSLRNWSAFEFAKPNLFAGMYRFACVNTVADLSPPAIR
jgi:SAM-dependent methyltransferase